MQMKIISFLVSLFLTIAVTAQQPVYTITNNNLTPAAKEASFSVSIIPDKVATAFNLFVQNTEKKRIGLQITHQELGLLVDTSFTDEQFKCRYNFDQVQDGYYQLTLISGKERIVKKIEINTVSIRQVVIQ